MNHLLLSLTTIIATTTTLHYHPATANEAEYYDYHAEHYNELCTGSNSLRCGSGYSCRNGSKDYERKGFPAELVNALPFFEITSIENEYCDCHEEEGGGGGLHMTGVVCTTMFERCPDQDTICFHGAPCVKGAATATATGDDDDTYYCDCSNTFPVDVLYTGRHCEYPVTTVCDTPVEYDVSESGQWMCANGGSCRQRSDGFIGTTCNCPPGFEGLHCEYPQGTAPVCNLDCFHDGICKIGVKDYQSISPPLREYFEQQTDSDGLVGEAQQHCVCPKGFTGRQCEASILVCGGDDNSSTTTHSCLNGGDCGTITSLPPSSSSSSSSSRGGIGETEYVYCDCGAAASNSTTTQEGGGLEVQFAGNACESSSSTFCTAPDGFDPLDFYCTNGGICGENSWDECNCSADYSGPRCEFLVQYHTRCDMQCENGGTCFFGGPPTTTPYDGIDLELQPSPKQQQQQPQLPSTTKSYCRCPDGFIGVHCETKIEICGKFEHHCLNGGLCVLDADEYTCQCPFDGLIPHAGEYCQHAATEICKGTRESFCTNHGKCKNVIELDHPGCVCSDGFKGNYCEITPQTHVVKVIVKDLMWVYMTLFLVTTVSFAMLLLYYHLPRGVTMVSVPEEEEEEEDVVDVSPEYVLPEFKHYLN